MRATVTVTRCLWSTVKNTSCLTSRQKSSTSLSSVMPTGGVDCLTLSEMSQVWKQGGFTCYFILSVFLFALHGGGGFAWWADGGLTFW